MSQSQPTQENQDAILEELVAYLDGELEPADAERIETRLSEDPAYRTELKGLQGAWDMLDLLPRPQVGEGFTRSTIEMVAVKAADDTAKRRGSVRLRRAAGWLAVVSAAVVAGFVGYRAVHHRLDRPNRQFLEDLPVVENVDLYYHADDIEFVEKLAASGIFDEEVEPVDSVPDQR